MKNFSADLTALLALKIPLERTDLFAIGPCLNGAMIYACTGHLPVTLAGNVYRPGLYGRWSRGSIAIKIGLESQSCDLTVLADNQNPVYFPGTSGLALLMDGIEFGLLGDADVTVSTLYNSPSVAGYAFPSVTGPTGGSLIEVEFVGEVGEINEIGLTKSVITAQDLLYRLNEQVPHRLIQASCSHTLFDDGCTLAASAFTKTGAVATVTYPNVFVTTAHVAPASPAGTFALGVLTWTSGNNTGLSSVVRAWTPGGSSDQIQLDIKTIFPIQAGDAFSFTQGCNKTFTSCADLQGSTNSYVNFGGQPDTPVPETAIGGGS